MKQMPVLSFFSKLSKPARSRHFTHQGLFQLAEREEASAELVLVKQVQEVALVLVGVQTLEQARVPAGAVDAGIVAGGHEFAAQAQRMVQKRLELDFPVAQHIRVGGAAGLEFAQEVVEDLLPVFRAQNWPGEEECPVRSRLAWHRPSPAPAVHIRVRVIVFPVLHEQAFDGVALLKQAQGGHGGVDAARQAYDDFCGFEGHLKSVPADSRPVQEARSRSRSRG